MRDLELFTAVRAVMLAGYVAQGRGDVAVKQSYQPTTIGADEGPTLYLSKLFDRPVGHPHRVTSPDPDTLEMILTETQVQERHFQATAVYRPNETGAGWSASDIANAGRAWLGSDRARGLLLAEGLGILRVAQVQNPKSLNGAEQYEAFPSFDFVLIDEDVLITGLPAIVGTPELRVARV